MRLGRWAVLALGIGAAACAPTIGPIVPSVQVIVVLDSVDDALLIIPVDTPTVVHTVTFGVGQFAHHALALNGQVAAIGLGNAMISWDLAAGKILCGPRSLDASGAPIAALTFADNGFVYAAYTATDSVPAIGPATCATGTGFVRGGPVAFVNARSRLFVVTGATAALSWLTDSTGQTLGGTQLPSADSILLSPPGNAQGAVLGSDGLIYVINAGRGQPNARLSQVNPITRTELSVIPGFGTLPRYIATDGINHIFVADSADGLMVYNLRTNAVERSATSAIPLDGHDAPRGLSVDDVGRVYVLLAGGCAGPSSAPGKVQIFGSDLVTARLVNVGTCPVAIGVTSIPATLYHFDN